MQVQFRWPEVTKRDPGWNSIAFLDTPDRQDTLKLHGCALLPSYTREKVAIAPPVRLRLSQLSAQMTNPAAKLIMRHTERVEIRASAFLRVLHTCVCWRHFVYGTRTLLLLAWGCGKLTLAWTEMRTEFWPTQHNQHSDWLRAEGPRGWSPSSGRVNNFLFFTSSRPALGPTKPHIQWVPGALSPEVKRQGRKAYLTSN
jgi:hypothetical protein